MISTVTKGSSAYDYTYDSNGNIASDDRHTYVYNEQNQLYRVMDGQTVLGDYTYNAKGQRVKKVASGTTIYHYDLMGNMIQETDGSGNVIASYVYAGTMRLAKIESGGTVYYYHNDYLGTPLALTDTSGAVVWKAAYNPFGKAEIDPSSTVTNNFRFPGQYYDTESGLHYNWYRYYDPGTGRYVTADPVGLSGGINLFLYVGGNPLNKSDIEGLKESSRCDCPPPLPEHWKPCIDEGLASFCTSGQANFSKVRCIIWGESSDNPNPQGGLPGGGLMQIKWELWEATCKAKIKNFDKNNPCDQIKCGIYILCVWAKGAVEKYGTVTGPGSQYKKCMECNK